MRDVLRQADRSLVENEMIIRAHWICTAAAALLSLLHLFVATRIYRDLTVDALWFSGTGLALLAIALINLLRLSEPTRLSAIVALAANVLTMTFMVLLASVHPAPQVFFGLALFVALTLCSSRLPPKARAT